MFQFKVIGPDGSVESEHILESGKLSHLLDEMAELHAPQAVRTWVYNNGTHRPLKWHYDGGRKTVRVTPMRG